ncbi:MAG: lytic transglycosylase domain-containing protein [Proteobacteria bacterium]|nr:lytic transglycosylase domain-containing protein [Pseudomonadota bacterium]
MTKIRALLAVGFATLSLVASSSAAKAATLEALSDNDARLYSSAFQAAERGDFATADDSLAHVKDPCLVGRVQYLKLIHPTVTKSVSYDQLVGWLKSFKDMPGADRIYALALRLRPAGEEPPPPETALASNLGGDRVKSAPQYRPAREAYFDGKLDRALSLAKRSGDAWIAGLASYRLQDFQGAMGFFETLARNSGENDWVRAGGAFWAARSADALSQPDRAQSYLRIAAALPDTFYGMIAARRLTLTADPMGGLIQTALANAGQPMSMRPVKINASGLDAPGVLRLVQTDPRARRAIALMQIGRPIDAGLELRNGMAQASSEDERSAWATLVYALNPNHQANAAIAVQTVAPAVQGVVYPTPRIEPAGGFVVNKALVYAVTWQESRFNPMAVSPVGALGMMQVMPAAAASVTGDESFKRDVVPLFDGPTNVQIGQRYLAYLNQHATGNDLLRTIASYNGGPGMVARTEALLGPDVDSLLFMESMPYYETRAYVQKVMAAYWAYQRQFGGKTVTLDAAASGMRIIDAKLDR